MRTLIRKTPENPWSAWQSKGRRQGETSPPRGEDCFLWEPAGQATTGVSAMGRRAGGLKPPPYNFGGDLATRGGERGMHAHPLPQAKPPFLPRAFAMQVPVEGSGEPARHEPPAPLWALRSNHGGKQGAGEAWPRHPAPASQSSLQRAVGALHPHSATGPAPAPLQKIIKSTLLSHEEEDGASPQRARRDRRRTCCLPTLSLKQKIWKNLGCYDLRGAYITHAVLQ